MLINNSRLVNCPILSLHISGVIAHVVESIVDPDSLKIIAYRVDGPLVGKEMGSILPVQSVREYSRLGMIVDSADEFVEEDEIVRIREVLALNFSLLGLKVETKKRKTKLGKVIDFTVEPGNWQVQQLVVQRPILKSFFDPELIISRQQIIEVNDYRVLVKDGDLEAKAETSVTQSDFVPSFVNPFREPELAAERESKSD